MTNDTTVRIGYDRGAPELTKGREIVATQAIHQTSASNQDSDLRFGMKLAIAMALTAVAGFSVQYLAGRSTFDAPLRVHLHAVAFFGWLAIFVAQGWLGTHGSIALHRRLGWLAMGWMGFMLAMGTWVIVAAVRAGTAPFFFRPAEFLIENPGTILLFMALTGYAVARRRETDWHIRLHVCALAAIMGPAFGRLLPMPLLIPHAFESAVVAGLVFPAAGMVRDLRRDGRIHPAWWRGLAILLAGFVVIWALAHSPVAVAAYDAVTAGSPGAAIPGLEFAPPPAPPA